MDNGEGMQPTQTEITPKETPTGASKGFLAKMDDFIIKNPFGSVIAALSSIGGLGFAGGAISDFMQGNYPSAAIEGVAAGIIAIPAVRAIKKVYVNVGR